MIWTDPSSMMFLATSYRYCPSIMSMRPGPVQAYTAPTSRKIPIDTTTDPRVSDAILPPWLSG